MRFLYNITTLDQTVHHSNGICHHRDCYVSSSSQCPRSQALTSLVAGEPAVYGVVGEAVPLVGEAAARVLAVPEAVEVGQSPALLQDRARQVGPAIVKISEINDTVNEM